MAYVSGLRIFYIKREYAQVEGNEKVKVLKTN